MPTWTGVKRLAVIPAVTTGAGIAPVNFRQRVIDRIFHDPATTTNIDCSLRKYIHTVSYGRALLDAEVLPTVTVNWAIHGTPAIANPGQTMDDAIAAAGGGIAGYQYIMVVFPAGIPGIRPWAFQGSVPRSYVFLDGRIGSWAMELLHMVTNFWDLYGPPAGRSPTPGSFDEMDTADATHPSVFTKLHMGWLDQNAVSTVIPEPTPRSFVLHPLARLQPPPPGRTTGIRIPIVGSSTHYLLVEAREKLDDYESGAPTNNPGSGLGSEGVVVFDVDEGTWPPLWLKTNVALKDSDTFSDASSQLELRVDQHLTGGGYRITIKTTVGDVLHLVGVTSDGRLWHTIRYETFWSSFGDVKAASSNPGTILDADCSLVQGELHVCAVTNDGRLWHTIRHTTSWSWDSFGDVKAAASDPGMIVKVVGAEVNGELHVCAVTNDGRLWHTIRHAASWDSFGDVKAAASDPGAIVEIACASVNGELHVCAVTNDGRLWHTIRHATSWDSFGDVKAAASDPGTIVKVGAAAVNGELHVSGLTMNGWWWWSDGRLWHTIRHAASWDSFADVEGPAGDRGSFQSVSLA